MDAHEAAINAAEADLSAYQVNLVRGAYAALEAEMHAAAAAAGTAAATGGGAAAAATAAAATGARVAGKKDMGRGPARLPEPSAPAG
jgi:hypothetical protein